MIKKFLSMLVIFLSVTFTASAMQFDKEYNCRVGVLWGFPHENVTLFQVSDPAMAFMVRKDNGQYYVRALKSGDFYILATFKESDGSTVRQVYLMHATGVNGEEIMKSNYAEEVLKFVNIEREKRNLQPLSLAKDLSELAMIRAEEQTEYFSHTRPDGSAFNTVAAEGTYKKLGENINGGAKSAEQVVDEWMHSPLHKENILYPNYNEMGVAYFYKPDTKYKHYWVQLFRLR